MFELLEHCDGEEGVGSCVRLACLRSGALLLAPGRKRVRLRLSSWGPTGSASRRRCWVRARREPRPRAAAREVCAVPRHCPQGPDACCLPRRAQASARATGGERKSAPWGSTSRTAPWYAHVRMLSPAYAAGGASHAVGRVPCPCSAAPFLLWRALLTSSAGPQAAHLLKGMVKGINKDGAALSQTKEAAKMQAMADDAMI